MTRMLIVALALLVSAGLFAHPEDDFCEPGDDSMDPALCAALAELNSAEGKIRQSEMPFATSFPMASIIFCSCSPYFLRPFDFELW